MNDDARILRIKHGYNPNSSSVGSDIPMFLTLTAASGAAALVALNIRSLLRDRRNKQTILTPHGKDATDTIKNDNPASDSGDHDRVSSEGNV